MLFAGFDGGGTKCEGVVIDESGKVLARFVGGSTNQNSIGWDAALSNFSTVVQELFAQLPATSVVTGACLGMSGVDREPEKLRWTEAATRLLRIDLSRVRVSNDAVTALASGTGGRLEGISLIAGTGTIALGMHAGLSVRAQGWGPVLGDEGSGYAVGQAALRAVARASDGIDEPTLLTELVLAAAGCTRCQELIGWAYSGPELPWARVAALAPCVEAAAALGDRAALTALDRAAHALLEAIAACAKRCAGLERPFDVVFSGGLLRKDSPVSRRLEELLAKEFGTDARIVHPVMSAADAAALIAMKNT